MTMTKNDLKTGWVVENEEGTKYRVFKNSEWGDYLANETSRDSLRFYDDDLLNRHVHHLSIIKVYKPATIYDLYASKNLELIWERV